MFYCDKCNKLSKAGEASHKLITQKRDQVYYGGRSGQEIIGYGWEILKEITVGACCIPKETSDE